MKSPFFLETTSQAAPPHVTFSIVAAVQYDPCQWAIIDILQSIQASQELFERKVITALWSADKRAIYRGKQHLWYWSRLTFGPVICCFIFKSNSSGMRQLQVWQEGVPADDHIKRWYTWFFSGCIKHLSLLWGLSMHVYAAQYKYRRLLESSTGASRVSLLKVTSRDDVEELESIPHLVSPPTSFSSNCSQRLSHC